MTNDDVRWTPATRATRFPVSALYMRARARVVIIWGTRRTRRSRRRSIETAACLSGREVKPRRHPPRRKDRLGTGLGIRLPPGGPKSLRNGASTGQGLHAHFREIGAQG
jgi:hypothetical protein